MSNYKLFFNVFSEFVEQYRSTVDIGKKLAADSNVIITGLTRNNEEKLYNNIQLLSNLKTRNLQYFIYENDSTDNTVNILNKLNQNIPNFKFQSEQLNLVQYGQVKDSNRTIRLAQCRNICLDYIKSNFNNIDYVIVIDLDFSMFSLEGLYHSLGLLYNNTNIHGVAGFSYEIKNNRILWNYDSWAFRWTWWEDLQKYHQVYNNVDPMGWFGLYYPPMGSDPILVNSAFGGCCVYRAPYYLQGYYSGEDCEHVTFHKSLCSKTDFQLVASPSQIMVF
jgi:glycosyltransferase involved in cell wall biosynthesis